MRGLRTCTFAGARFTVTEVYLPRLRTCRSFGYGLWDPESRQVVRSADMVFNESNMDTLEECPIKLRRVTFSDATPTNDPAMHTRAALQSVASMATTMDTNGTSLVQDPVGHESSTTATTAITATNDEPASPVLPR